MHLIPSHQGRPSDDPIFALNKEATARRQAGDAIVNATVGALLDDDGKLAILPTAARAVHEVPPVEWATYAPIAGTPDFLRAVIDDLLGGEPDLKRAAVAVATPGGSGALRHAVANFLEPGQAMLTTSWFWGPYQTLCDESERKLETFEMFRADGGLDVAALDAGMARQLAEQKRALVFLNDPCHNPTGYSMTDDEWRAVVERIAARAASGAGPVTLLVDCAYFLYGARDPRAFLRHLRPLVAPRPAGEAGKGGANVLFAWSASKSFTHYGLRVGALVACVPDEAERAAVEAALSYSCRGTWSNCNRGGLTAITRLLVDPEMARAAGEERAGLKKLLLSRVAAFNRHAHARGLRYPRYEGGFFVTVFDDHAKEKAEAMRAKGVYVVPQVRKGGGGALRVALCSVAERDVERLVDALA
ncbi:MAG TPA: aminotransferase class I/II-fold pyridoxal phosphate-dependent enzyme [Polyangiaceae bacterium]|jgi:aromatic-amino-acid transaminase